MSEKVEAYLAKNKKTAKTDVADIWLKFEQLYGRKLWHQLTQEIRAAQANPAFTASLNQKEFYDGFISEFEHRINALQLVEIVLPIAKFIFGKDKEAAYDFLSKIEKTVNKDKIALARVHAGQIELRLNHKDSGDRLVDIKKDMIESTQKEIESFLGVTEAHAPFYKVSAMYLKEIGDFAGYYREALRYLGVEDITKMTAEEKHVQAVLIGFAALLGENVYNFGELLAHPILKALAGSSEKWLSDVLHAFNCGDLNKFYSLEKHWSEWDDLKRKKDFLVGKIRLLAIMELALARPSKERKISFREIATKCQVSTSEVELLVMKALSKDLVRGAIDQVNQNVLITWVQPRVLNTSQVLLMANRIAAWSKDVIAMENIVSENAREILTKS
ncbi:PCI domain protein [Necator americanus]|uniref:26S proteasome non-ATPase regulatory subunit 13 n=1 Tax=Necator americanus TaxID=51031 RepID=W2SWN8_NECAM|nr:PCI domain protein [Necator americanus]ETN73918.1 PCI domain protein [Necator americanus]